ncbi:MAG: hypothetical protein HY268_20635 [Deltaproteobacteria bacterium]|nr:hypothetical protein [Deltaproteobacteria bacterium]
MSGIEETWYTVVVNWLIKNKEWIFSGIGVAAIAAIIAITKKLFSPSSSVGWAQKQKAGRGSHNLQVGGDINITVKGKNPPDDPAALLNAQAKAKHEERLFHKQKLREQELQAQQQKQNELRFRPFVILEATHENLQVRNIGDDTAINIKIGDFQLNSMGMTANFPGSVPPLGKGECTPLKEKKLLVGGEIIQGSHTDLWFSILKPLRTRIAKPAKIDFRPEITVEFQDIKGQRYFVKERLAYGEMEVVDSGML